jgi:trimethylguanosine synthase
LIYLFDGMSRSLFASLPRELKKSIRTQPRQPTPSDPSDTVEIKIERVSAALDGQYLPTQPDSPDAQKVDPSEKVADANETTSRNSVIEPTPVTPPRQPTNRKKRKRNSEVPIEPENALADHPWDCTGLVPRYTQYQDVPLATRKCEPDPRHISS